jgi:hypothetical protein
MVIKFVVLLVFILFLVTGCWSFKGNTQPVVIFVISGENYTSSKSIILSLVPIIATNNKLKYTKRISKNNDVFIYATQNSFVFGNGVDFSVRITEIKINIYIIGSPDEPKVHALINQWQKALNDAEIEYSKVIRQPYLNNKVTPKDDPSWKAMNS